MPSDSTFAVGKIIRASHVTALQTAVQQARYALGLEFDLYQLLEWVYAWDVHHLRQHVR
jgi:hypothetical protein